MSQEVPLTREYIEAHLSDVQTFESFGRCFSYAVMKHAIELIGNEGPVPALEIPARIFLRPVVAEQCIEICVRLDHQQVCLRFHTTPPF